FNGAEPVRARTLKRFAERFAPCGFQPRFFFPCYGMAEATLMISGGPAMAEPRFCAVDAGAFERQRVEPVAMRAPNAKIQVGCGHLWQETQVAIVDPRTSRRCGPDQVGEIWVGGPTVAQGYWNKPEATEETFAARIEETDEGPYLRTGDLGYFRDGELFIAGRLKDLIIIRGRNHYPQDLELTVEDAHPAVRRGCTAAFSVDQGGEERLVVVVEVDRHTDAARFEELQRQITRAVSEIHEVQVHEVALIKTGTIFKSSSGKIQRRACRKAYQAGTLERLDLASRPQAGRSPGSSEEVSGVLIP
ncbi:MAG: AMP-binding protein, partial [Cyanobacteria bacterium REEB65]|nr:AMP-binding protein [Cyanobacteria bacterium REEB65]